MLADGREVRRPPAHEAHPHPRVDVGGLGAQDHPEERLRALLVALAQLDVAQPRAGVRVVVAAGQRRLEATPGTCHVAGPVRGPAGFGVHRRRAGTGVLAPRLRRRGRRNERAQEHGEGEGAQIESQGTVVELHTTLRSGRARSIGREPGDGTGGNSPLRSAAVKDVPGGRGRPPRSRTSAAVEGRRRPAERHTTRTSGSISSAQARRPPRRLATRVRPASESRRAAVRLRCPLRQ